jgi:hypothetical protein
MQNRAPAMSGVAQLAQATTIDDPQWGQKRASAGAVSSHVGQIIDDRVPNRLAMRRVA